MDPKLKVFLELIHSIIKSGGKGYGDEKFGLVMQPNGLCSIRYAPLMDQYKAEILTRQALINREQQFDQEAMETEERAANMYQMGSNLDETWQARNESRRTLGQQRGDRLANRANRANEPPQIESQQQSKAKRKRKQS